jgi:DNA-binding CsgD family transcriptional regulator
MHAVQLFQHALEQWATTQLSDRQQVFELTKGIEARCTTGTNLYVVDMQGDDPLAFHNNTLVENVDMKGDQSRLGNYPDQDYVKNDVIPFYLRVKEDGEPNLMRMKSVIQGHYAVYDRLLLPMQEHGKTRWALSMTKTRVLIPPKPDIRSLTDRQQDILALFAQGLSSKEAALRLDISYRTVEHQIAAIKKKLGAKNITEAVAIFVGKALLE